jgi:carbamoyltransferase
MTKTHYTLGLNAFHGDASACIFKNDVLICASEEERFRRVKHWAGFPTQAISFCLEEAGITPVEVDVIAVSRDPKANKSKKIWYALTKGVSLKAILDRLKNKKQISDIKTLFAEGFGLQASQIKAEVMNVEHHLSHLASAFYPSTFEKAAVLSIDGFGDFSSCMTGVGDGNTITTDGQLNYPHSLGVFYTACTQFLGFPHYGDEYKVMGLAPYGKPTFVEALRNIIQASKDGFIRLNPAYFSHVKHGVKMAWDGGEPHVGQLYTDAFVKLFGAARETKSELSQTHFDFAASVQRITEEMIFHMAESLQQKTGLKKLCLAGGVAQNSVANGKIIDNTSFDELFVPPAGHDAGTSIGAALVALNKKGIYPRHRSAASPYTGYQAGTDEVAAIANNNPFTTHTYEHDALLDTVANALVNGAVVGWYQGRAEFGPRALGHRSIIVDPRRTDAKDLLNAKIKRRESFRPFAPSILAEYQKEYFGTEAPVPYMEKVFPIVKDKHAAIPAVTHVDGTGRLQSVLPGDIYHELITKFYDLTGVPVLLNTSFNENEPIVNTAQEAYACFERTQMDMLVLNNTVITR